jgi:hypothetical protein
LTLLQQVEEKRRKKKEKAACPKVKKKGACADVGGSAKPINMLPASLLANSANSRRVQDK